MTKVFDALRRAEAKRVARTESPVSCDVLFQGPAPAPVKAESDAAIELERLRSIVLGTAVSDFEQGLRRVEERLAAEESSLRAEISKFEQRIEGRLAEVDSRATQGQSQMREQILSQSNQLGDKIKERSAEVVRLLNEGLDDLRQTKMDSTEFSKFVRALAGHLVDRD